MDAKTNTMTLGGAVKKAWTATYAIEKETPGTIRYAQVDEKGRVITPVMSSCVAQTLYIRKTAFKGMPVPERLTVTINAE